MQSYKLIKGTDQNIENFEQQVSAALDEGYVFSADLIVKSVTDHSGRQHLLLLQAMTYEEETDPDEEFYLEDEEDDDL